MKSEQLPTGLSRRSFLSSASGAIALGLMGTTRSQAQSSPTSFETLRKNVGLFLGRGGTIGWMVTPDAVVVIDSQFPETAQICLDAVNEKSGGRPIDFLINTHHHGDHVGGNVTFRAPARRIVAHKRVVELLKKGAAQNPQNEPTYPDMTFSEAWSVDLGSEKITAKYYGPAHTSGDITIHFEGANVVHVGDLMFNRRHPFIDRPAGASIANWIDVLERIVADHEDDTLFIFGHAGEGWQVTGGKPELFYQRDYLTALLEHTRGEISSGKSRDDIVSATPELAGFSDHGPLISRVLSVAYDELTESR